MIFIYIKSLDEYKKFVLSNDILVKAQKQSLIKPLLPNNAENILRRYSCAKIFNPFEYSVSKNAESILSLRSGYFIDDIFDYISVCKKCGNAFNRFEDFVDDDELLDAINRYINVENYCPFCIEEIDNEIYEFVKGLDEEG